MNANAFRHFYNYHFTENRKIWNYVTSLPHEQFTQAVDYSRGSVRDQIVHLIDAEEMWFSELRVVEPSEPLPPADFDDRDTIRAHWDNVEQNIRGTCLASKARWEPDAIDLRAVNRPNTQLAGQAN